MEHAVEVMRALVALADEGKIALKRSKNRFSRPSAGGWMDCLVNFKLGSTGCVCEVQIVHQQLLTVRSELGAHHSYATYRSAGELLEWLGVGGFAEQSLEKRKRAVLKTVLRMLRVKGGAGLDLDNQYLDWEQMVSLQSWGLLPAMPESVWPRIERLVLPKLCNGITGWCLDNHLKSKSLAAAILRESVSGVVTRSTIGRKEAVKLARELSVLKRNVTNGKATEVKLDGWLAAGHDDG